MIFSENRYPLFRIMLQGDLAPEVLLTLAERLPRASFRI
jgi:hypothetical protein